MSQSGRMGSLHAPAAGRAWMVEAIRRDPYRVVIRSTASGAIRFVCWLQISYFFGVVRLMSDTEGVMLQSRLRKSGGSVVLSIPKTVLELAGLKESDAVNIRLVEGHLLVSGVNAVEAIEETPELLAAIAEAHAATASARKAVDQALQRRPEAEMLPVIDVEAIRAELRAELADGVGDRLIDLLGHSRG